MEPVRFWAAVRFTAQNGGTDGTYIERFSRADGEKS